MLLIVDDETNITASLKEYFIKQGYHCIAANSGLGALDALERNSSLKVVVTDLKMPELNGLELFKKYKARNPESSTQFIFISGIKDVNSMRIGFMEGAVDYIFKPFSFEELKSSVDRAFQKYWEKEDTIKNVSELKHLIHKNHLETIKIMLKMIQTRDNYTETHCKRVSRISGMISESMGLPKEDISGIKLAGLLHDVGKIGIPDTILLKPGELTKEEYEIIKEHSLKGYNIIKDIVTDNVAKMILYHHEYVNGKGYPYGIKGKAIPLGARIIAVADQYDALRSNRPYRKTLAPLRAIEIMKEDTRKKFDPQVTKHFLSVVQEIERYFEYYSVVVK